MAFRVEIAPRALADLDEIAQYIKQQGSAESAEQWFNGIIDAIAALKKMPARCPITEESEQLGYEVRVLLHGRRNRGYKVYYSLDYQAQTIHVLHVRHWARTDIDAADLGAPIGERDEAPDETEAS